MKLNPRRAVAFGVREAEDLAFGSFHDRCSNGLHFFSLFSLFSPAAAMQEAIDDSIRFPRPRWFHSFAAGLVCSALQTYDRSLLPTDQDNSNMDENKVRNCSKSSSSSKRGRGFILALAGRIARLPMTAAVALVTSSSRGLLVVMAAAGERSEPARTWSHPFLTAIAALRLCCC